jgi:peptidoglycan LD-endopeptidase LytH
VAHTHRIVAVLVCLGVALGGCSEPPAPAASGPSIGPAPQPSESSESSLAPSPGPTPARTPAKPKAAAKPAATYAFPVIGKTSYAHTHHDYPATDIITDCGNKVVAVTAGTILAVTRVDRWKASVNAGATRGGLSVSLLGDDGVRYYGSHLSVINAGIEPGVHVTTGQPLAKVGDTGDASACHLHFGISPPCARTADWWNQRGTVYPWPFLDAWRKGQPKSAVAKVAAWKAANGCPARPRADP